MKLLVTGANGFIGRHVVKQAAARGISVVASSRSGPIGLPADVAFIRADLTNPEAASELIGQAHATHVIHAAWETRRPDYWESETNIDWLIATGAMARAFMRAGGQRFLQVGTCASYDWSYGLCIEGVTPDRPTTRYGAAKVAAFAAIQAAAHHAFDACEARIFLLYGPGEEDTRFVPLLCRAYLRGETPNIGSGRQIRDLLHVEDAASALLTLALAEGMTGVVNIGSGEPTALADVATLLADKAAAPFVGLRSRMDVPGDPDTLLPDTTRLRSAGWLPTIALAPGLEATLASHRERRPL